MEDYDSHIKLVGGNSVTNPFAYQFHAPTAVAHMLPSPMDAICSGILAGGQHLSPAYGNNNDERVQGNTHVVQADMDKGMKQVGGRSFTIYQTCKSGDPLGTPDIASFKTYIGGMFLKGYTKLCLEHVELVNGFTNPLACLGIHIGNTIANATFGNSSQQLGGVTGDFQPTFSIPFLSGGVAAGDTGTWYARWADQKCIPIQNFNDQHLQIVLTDELGKKLTWDSTTAVYLLLQFTAY